MATSRLSAILLGAALAWPASAAEPQRAQLDVPGMNCSLCPVAVKKVLERAPGVLEAKADLATKSAQATYDPARTSPEALARRLTDAGYQAMARTR
jgi:mercuric ion binding protein